jgi:hypothetical protein
MYVGMQDLLAQPGAVLVTMNCLRMGLMDQRHASGPSLGIATLRSLFPPVPF